jgi:hypothetical protein
MKLRRSHSSYKKWESYSRYSRYFDAEEDHFCDAKQFDRADHPYYFDATQFKNDWDARKHEYLDAMQFDESDEEDDMYVEFFDAVLKPDGNESTESPTDCAIALVADKSARAQREDHGYDTDSFWIAVDNCCSRSILNCLTDFITPPKRANVSVQGISGSGTANLMGTVKWSIEDDAGVVHSFLLRRRSNDIGYSRFH